jgi:hypothetical protein
MAQPKPYYKVHVYGASWCSICDKSHPNQPCPLVTSQDKTAGKRRGSGLTAGNARQDRLQREKEKLNEGVEEQLKQEAWARVEFRQRRPSDAVSVLSESEKSMSSQCWSVSTAATLPLTKAEEMEARKLEAQLRNIENSMECKESLPKSEVRRNEALKTQLNYSAVMVKVRGGAERWTLDRVPLSQVEEKQVRGSERRLRHIERLEDRKARGEWLEGWEMKELACKRAIESSALMVRVREGAPRCALPGDPQRAPGSALVPTPVRSPAPKASPPAPAPKASPSAPAPACAPVAKASPSLLPAANPASASPALPTRAEHDDAESSADVPTKPQGPTLKHMVATIREELELEDSLNHAQVVAEANLQLGLPATGILIEQARALFNQLTEDA